MPRAFLLSFLALSTIAAVVAQQAVPTGQTAGQTGGDQFLDGIGETSLIARYQFNGNTEDSSRNQLHARMLGPGGAFVEDGQRLLAGHRVDGPAIVEQMDSTTVILPGQRGTIDSRANILIEG